MGCGYRDENGDICGETFTCKVCRSENDKDVQMRLLRSQITDLQNVVKLLAWHIRRGLGDEARMELDDELSGTAMQ